MHRGYTLLWRKIWGNSVLIEPGRRFSRLEAWLYLANVLAAGKDDDAAGIKRGEFVASVRCLSKNFNWSHGTTQRFIDLLIQQSMIARVVRESVHGTVRDAGHFCVCNYETYNPLRNVSRHTKRYAKEYDINKESIKEIEKDYLQSNARKSCVSPEILLDIFRQHNQVLPEVKAITAERLRKCRSRINQAVRDGCLEQYLADFAAAVKKAQLTPFLRGEGVRGWRANFDWLVANHVHIYAVLEGKYDGPCAKANNGKGDSHGSDSSYFDCEPGGTSARRTSRGDPIYCPRQ